MCMKWESGNKLKSSQLLHDNIERKGFYYNIERDKLGSNNFKENYDCDFDSF